MNPFKPLLPIHPLFVDPLPQRLLRWFSVSEDEVRTILESVREKLPTTEAFLLGKSQSGKSSIVRVLTGGSVEMVGQGFRPHTKHTQRYVYPTPDFPLLVFIDTVGIGDVSQPIQVEEKLERAQAIIQELTGKLQTEQTQAEQSQASQSQVSSSQTEPSQAPQSQTEPSQASRSQTPTPQSVESQVATQARIGILTIKITDFATDSLLQLAKQLKQIHPEIPCLLAVTCLHELYPTDIGDHPDYPPTFPDLERAFASHQKTFAGVCDRAVLIDFTLEEDSYNPVFYGLDAFRDALTDLLPAAEANAIHQLLEQEFNQSVSQRLGSLYRDVGRRYIAPFAVMAATLAAVPLPFATMPVLTALQVSMVGLLGQLYGQTLSRSQAGGVVSAIAGGFLAQAIGRELVKFVPGLGSMIAASWAAAYTWALGESACVYFGDLMGGKKPDPQRIQQAMRESFAIAKERFKEFGK
jgi:uncharacterized protein (DUF697 family)